VGPLQLDVCGVIVVTRIRGFAHVRILDMLAILGSIIGKVSHAAGGISEGYILLTTGTTQTWRGTGREKVNSAGNPQDITDDCTCMAMA